VEPRHELPVALEETLSRLGEREPQRPEAVQKLFEGGAAHQRVGYGTDSRNQARGGSWSGDVRSCGSFTPTAMEYRRTRAGGTITESPLADDEEEGDAE
jgi:hypothetical protein